MTIRRRTAWKPEAYVLTPHEVADHYFRRAPDVLNSDEFRKLHPTFPRPRNDGLYHRGQIEAWVDLTFGIAAELRGVDLHAAAMEAAQRGPRQSAARKAS